MLSKKKDEKKRIEVFISQLAIVVITKEKQLTYCRSATVRNPSTFSFWSRTTFIISLRGADKVIHCSLCPFKNLMERA